MSKKLKKLSVSSRQTGFKKIPNNFFSANTTKKSKTAFSQAWKSEIRHQTCQPGNPWYNIRVLVRSTFQIKISYGLTILCLCLLVCVVRKL